MTLWISSAQITGIGWDRVCAAVDRKNPTRQYTRVHGNQRFLSGGILLRIMKRGCLLSTDVYNPVYRNIRGL
ncbi:MAG: hypothetical protein LZF86_120059 [Nitrospira sp.]|nr:MAG: hypothetical protein LZF86_120059 [Nitrospira sp.]